MPFIFLPAIILFALLLVSAVIGFVFNIIAALFIAAGLGIIFGVVLYGLPSIIAFRRGHSSKWGIAVLNWLAGWTLIGWVAAFVWAFIDTPQPETHSFSERLFEIENLYKTGKLTPAEYEAIRKKTLGL